MPAPAFLALPYHVARTPLTVLDMTLVQRLPERSSVRRTFEKAFGSMDALAGQLFGDQSLQRQAAERLRGFAPPPAKRPAQTRPASDDSASSDEKSKPKSQQSSRPSAGEQAREDVTRRRQPRDTRANQNLATIRMNLAATEAIADAHEAEAEQREQASEQADSPE